VIKWIEFAGLVLDDQYNSSSSGINRLRAQELDRKPVTECACCRDEGRNGETDFIFILLNIHILSPLSLRCKRRYSRRCVQKWKGLLKRSSTYRIAVPRDRDFAAIYRIQV
jgi:hypothetical protein